MSSIRDLAENAKSWPFDEARKLLKRLGDGAPDKGYVLFETGYGPSGLPHIGTFGEVVRTTMVRHAFSTLSDLPTRLLFAFSDDMDGLRRVPDNIPNKEMVAEHLGKPLTSIPDPFETHDSFGAHNNARLQAFLDQFGFDYEFMSATECYRSGRFDDTAAIGAAATTKRSSRSSCPPSGPSGARPIARSCRCASGRAGCCRCRWSNAMPTPVPSSMRTRTVRRSRSR